MGEGRIADTVIEGVKLIPLKIIEDERGRVRHMLRSDDPHFETFGEVYFSEVFPGAVKAWHLHKKMTLNYACVSGRVLVALVDGRSWGKTRLIEIETYQLSATDPDEYALLTIPPGVWNGFRALSPEGATVANCATLPHDPDEILRKHPSGFIDFDWGSYEIAG